MQLSMLVDPSPAAYRPAKHSMHPTSPLLAAFTLMLSAVGLVYGLAAFTPTRVLNGRSGTPLHTHTAFWGALAAAWSPERRPAA